MKPIIRQLLINKLRIKSPNVKFGLLSRIGDDSSFEGNNCVGKFSFVNGCIGVNSYIGDNVMLIGCWVGRYTSISSNVHIINGRHPLKSPYVSTSPVFYTKHTPINFSYVEEQLFEEYVFADPERKTPIIIGNDCWIGFGVSIVEGVTIGDGAVVLSNATVTKDVPPYSIVGGVPAKVLGYRYDENTIEKLLTIKWWNKDELWIKKNVQLFLNIEEFIKLV